MELALPINYVELEQDEMMYLDGGWRDWIVKGVGVAISGFAAGVMSTWGKQFAKKYSVAWIGNKALAFGGWIKATILGVINWAWANPIAALTIASGVAATAAYAFKKAGY